MESNSIMVLTLVIIIGLSVMVGAMSKLTDAIAATMDQTMDTDHLVDMSKWITVIVWVGVAVSAFVAWQGIHGYFRSELVSEEIALLVAGIVVGFIMVVQKSVYQTALAGGAAIAAGLVFVTFQAFTEIGRFADGQTALMEHRSVSSRVYTDVTNAVSGSMSSVAAAVTSASSASAAKLAAAEGDLARWIAERKLKAEGKSGYSNKTIASNITRAESAVASAKAAGASAKDSAAGLGSVFAGGAKAIQDAGRNEQNYASNIKLFMKWFGVSADEANHLSALIPFVALAVAGLFAALLQAATHRVLKSRGVVVDDHNMYRRIMKRNRAAKEEELLSVSPPKASSAPSPSAPMPSVQPPAGSGNPLFNLAAPGLAAVDDAAVSQAIELIERELRSGYLPGVGKANTHPCTLLLAKATPRIGVGTTDRRAILEAVFPALAAKGVLLPNPKFGGTAGGVSEWLVDWDKLGLVEVPKPVFDKAYQQVNTYYSPDQTGDMVRDALTEAIETAMTARYGPAAKTVPAHQMVGLTRRVLELLNPEP